MLAASAALTACTTDSQKPPGPSAVEIRDYEKRMLDATWNSTGLADRGLTQPAWIDVEFVPAEEWNTALRSCMEKAGQDDIQFSWGTDSGYTLLTSNGEVNTNRKALKSWYNCVARFPVDPVISGDLASRAQLEYIYDFYARWTIPCLSLQGYSVQLPSRESFVSDTANRWWSPMWSTQVTTEEQYAKLLTVCGPESPDLGLDSAADG